MKICKGWILLSLVLVLMLSVPVAFGQSPAPPTSSVSSLNKSGTPVQNSIELRTSTVDRQAVPTPTPPDITAIINACAATADDLKKSLIYVNVLESQNKLLEQRLDTEKRATQILTELNETRRAETSALRGVIDAKNETLAAKESVIQSQDKLIATLKGKKPSPWRRLGDILIGAAVIAVLK